MSFSTGGGGGVSSATDVALSNPANNDALTFDTTTQKWKNSDISENVRDTIAASLVAGSNVSITPNDASNTITISSTSGGDNGLITTNSQTGTSYTLAIGDAGALVETTNSTSVTITVPTNSAVNFQIGTTIAVRQYGTGTINIAGAAGVIIRSRGAAYSLGGQYAEAMLTKRTTDEWILTGDLVA